MNLLQFKAISPLYVFDVSHQSEKLKNSTIDITVYLTFGVAPAANTTAYAITYCDTLFRLTGDNSKQVVEMY